jgi:hypothetical protein
LFVSARTLTDNDTEHTMTRNDLTALGTHAIPTTTRGTYRLFDITTCDQGGAPCMAANSVQVLGTSAPKLRAFGVKVDRYAPSEISYCDVTESCVCDACYVDEPEQDEPVQSAEAERLEQRVIAAYSNLLAAEMGSNPVWLENATDAHEAAESALVNWRNEHGVA